MPEELVVRYKRGVDAAERAAVRAEEGARLEKPLPLPGLEVVKTEPGESVEQAEDDFEDQPKVVYAEPNFIYRAAAVPSDPRLGELWGLHNFGQVICSGGGRTDCATGWPDGDIDAPEAWDRTTGSSATVLAVVDTGVDDG